MATSGTDNSHDPVLRALRDLKQQRPGQPQIGALREIFHMARNRYGYNGSYLDAATSIRNSGEAAIPGEVTPHAIVVSHGAVPAGEPQ